MINSAVAGYAPFLLVKLIVFPEFAHSAPVFATAQELSEKLAVEIPNEHTRRIQEKAKEHNVTFKPARCSKRIKIQKRAFQHELFDCARRNFV